MLMVFTSVSMIFLLICEKAFSDCENLTKVEIPTNSNLQIIGKNAFSSSNIKEIYIPSSVTTICEEAFSYCTNLAKVKIPKNSNLQIIKVYAFTYSNIDEIYIPPSVTKICESAFNNCTNISKIEIPKNSNLRAICQYAFNDSNIEEIYLPSSLIELDDRCFAGANKLTKIIISPLNGQFILKDDKYLLGKSDQRNDEFDTFLFARRDIQKIYIPSNIRIIGSFSFQSSNIKEIYIPSCVAEIGITAFFNCYKLQIIEISEESRLKNIPDYIYLFSLEAILMIPPSLKELISKCTSKLC